MGLYKSVEKRINWAVNVEFDNSTGFYRYKRSGKYIYIRHPRHFLKEKDLLWLCEKIFFHHYRPENHDVVVDLGAGYGEEAVYLSSYSPMVRYIGVEPQPVIYECLANTFRMLGAGFTASPYVVTNRDTVKFTVRLKLPFRRREKGAGKAHGIDSDTSLDRIYISHFALNCT